MKDKASIGLDRHVGTTSIEAVPCASFGDGDCADDVLQIAQPIYAHARPSQ
jgi:hypothetical protein